jgi:integrase/recombinase XerD
MTTTALARAKGNKPTKKSQRMQHLAAKSVAQRKTLPEYLEPREVEALILQAAQAQARLLMLTQWRAGLRISEALKLEVADLSFDADNPTLRIGEGKGKKPRLVPMHSELGAAFRNFLGYSSTRRGRIFNTSRSTAWRWVKDALDNAVQLNQIPLGRHVGTHTLRHSAARHWLASGVPINYVSLWLGHSSIQTTLIYLQVLPDPSNFMDRVP